MITRWIRLPAGRTRLRACLLALVMSMSFAPAAWSTPCDPTLIPPVPDCELQKQQPIHFSGWETQYWDFYCSGDHPYYWGLNSNIVVNFTWDNSCFSVIENLFGENSPNKFSGLFTNWCINGQSTTVTLGCSNQPPPGFTPACNIVAGPVGDPGCPQSNIQNHCSATLPPICFLTATETCSNGTRYECTADIGIVWCFQCGPQ
jgi:hypothetical protein